MAQGDFIVVHPFSLVCRLRREFAVDASLQLPGQQFRKLLFLQQANALLLGEGARVVSDFPDSDIHAGMRAALPGSCVKFA